MDECGQLNSFFRVNTYFAKSDMFKLSFLWVLFFFGHFGYEHIWYGVWITRSEKKLYLYGVCVYVFRCLILIVYLLLQSYSKITLSSY